MTDSVLGRPGVSSTSYGRLDIDLTGSGFTAELLPDNDERAVKLVITTHILGAPHHVGQRLTIRMGRGPSGSAQLRGVFASPDPDHEYEAMGWPPRRARLHGNRSRSDDR